MSDTRPALYIRVSDPRQVDGHSLETQLAGCRAYAGKLGLTVVSEFREKQTAVERFDRPELTKPSGSLANGCTEGEEMPLSQHQSVSEGGGTTGSARVVLYCRSATSNQEQAASALQCAELRAYCAQQGYTIVAEYRDDGYSGLTDRRPALAQLLTAITAGRADIVIVTGLDRLARSALILRRILAHLDASGVRLVSLAERCDSTAEFCLPSPA